MLSAFAVDRPVRGLAGATLSGGILLLAQPPFGAVLLPFFALVPFLVGLGSIPPGPRSSRRATTLGFIFGGVYWGAALVWVPVSVGPHFAWAFPGYLLLLLILCGLSGAFGWFVHFLHKVRGLPLSLAVPLAWVGVEWLKAHFPLGLSFPWLGLAVSLTEWPEFLVLAELGGEAAVSFWLAGVNALVAEAVLGPGSRRTLRRWILIASLILVPSAGGWIRSETLPLEDGLLVMAVGTARPPELPGSPAMEMRNALLQVGREISGQEPGTLDLVVLPEGLVPFPLNGEEAGEAIGVLRELAREVGAPLVFGARGGTDSRVGEGEETNSAFLMSTEGTVGQRYDKVQLVPGMEAGSYARGKERGAFRLGNWAAVPLICYESLFSGLARRGRRAGADVLLNLSSDIWFGGDGSLLGSLFLHQHPAHLVIRAVETRTPVVRSAKGGFTLLLDPGGREVAHVVPPEGGSVKGRLPVFRGLTVYSRTGDLVGLGSFLLCLMLLGGSLWAGRRNEKGTGRAGPPNYRPGLG